MSVPSGLADEETPAPQHQLSLRSQFNTSSQVAIIGSNLCPIESLDYEIIENDLFKQDWRTKGMTEIFQYIFMKWTFCFLIGLIMSLVGFFINLSIENIAGLKFVITSRMILAGKSWAAFIMFVCSNLGLMLFASLITAFIAPEAAGSGIPEVKAYLNGVDAPAIFSFRTLLVKIVGNIFAVSSCLHIGRAGPMVHTGACIAAIVGEGGSKNLRLNWKWLQVFKNDLDRRDFVTCGSAAGIAAAFRAPIGGVLFTLQEMSSWWRSALLWQAFFTTAVVAIVLRAMIGFCLRGECGLFGKGSLIVYSVTSANIPYQLRDVPPVLFLAVIGGMLGSLYNLLLIKILKIYQLIYKKGIVYKITLACFASVFTSCLLFGLPWIGVCHRCPSDASEPCPTTGRSGNFRKFHCPPGHYNDLASLFFNTNGDAIKNLFSKDTKSEFHYSCVFIFFSTSFLLSIFSYGVVAPAGLFVPIIVIGASYGRFIGMCVGSSSNLTPGLFAVLGSASLLGGSMRMTVSLCVIILELTDDLLMLPLIMIVALISKSVADVFDENIYDLIMALKGLPHLVAHAEPYMRQLTVGDVITGPLEVLNGIEKVGNIVHLLTTTGHNGFPVVDEPDAPSSSPLLFGLILRAHLIVVLKKKSFFKTPTQVCPDAVVQFTADDFLNKGCHIEDVELSEEEMEMFVDLHPFTNTSPYTVVQTLSLAKALRLFREVGLRHLLVIPNVFERVPVVGILTRHDFMPHHILKLHPTQKKWNRLRFRFSWLT
ncbi:hypothetical protein ACS0TY_021238 [Phlomoides rotata]